MFAGRLQVVHVCAEHKKPAKLVKHLTQIRVRLEASSFKL